MAQRVQLTATVSENQLGQRLDQALAEMFPDYSRSRIKEWILDQRVLVFLKDRLAKYEYSVAEYYTE
ncbi:S4 domain-containing protein, partial [Escherichia sp. TWPC-MK]